MGKIKLAPFDYNFLTEIKDYKKIHLNPNEGTYHTITVGGKEAGIIGFIIKEGDSRFLKIGIHQDFRGQGIFQKALELLVQKHNIKLIYSTIALANIASIKSHEKIGFKRILKKQEDDLKEKGLLLKRNIRMKKIY